MSSNENVDHNPYQEYLDKKHLKFDTPEKLIAKIVKKATDSEFSSREKVIAGEVNEVYDVTLKNMNHVIVRISRHTKPRFEAEEKVIRMASQVGVPTPKVLLIESLKHKGKKLTFCIEEKIDGVPLRETENTLDKRTLKSLIVQSGNILSKIHSVEVDGFGGFDRRKPYNKWSEYVYKPLKKKKQILKIAKVENIDTDLIHKAMDALKENKDVFDKVKPRLLHGDYSTKHMLTDKSDITGIIDFENGKGGDPIFDLAWFDYYHSDRIPLKWMKEGYTDKSIFDDNFDQKMIFYKLHLGLTVIVYYKYENNIAGLNHAKKKLIEDALLI